jgi:ketosteroid isomerase-like protein
MTTAIAMSRRYLLAGGAGSLALACGGGAVPAPSSTTGAGTPHQEGNVRRWYAAWEKKDWSTADVLTADDFTFSSAAGDDHISKATFKAQCWDTQAALIDRFDLESIAEKGDEAFVKYTCHTKSGKMFRNVEHFRFRGDTVVALACYFGEQSGFPSAANAGQK